MTDKEIVIALQKCNNGKGHRCSECPALGKYNHRICKATIDKLAVNLIERLQSELTAFKNTKIQNIKRKRGNKTMEKLIYCKFLDHEGKARGRDYTYLTDTEVQAGEFVEVEVTGNSSADSEPKKKKVVVTRVDVKPEDIPGYDGFKEKIKKIKGLWTDEVATEEQANEQI